MADEAAGRAGADHVPHHNGDPVVSNLSDFVEIATCLAARPMADEDPDGPVFRERPLKERQPHAAKRRGVPVGLGVSLLEVLAQDAGLGRAGSEPRRTAAGAGCATNLREQHGRVERPREDRIGSRLEAARRRPSI